MKALILTNEYPPNVYGGAGVHVEFLTQEMKKLIPVNVRCFGDQNLQEEFLTVQGLGLDSQIFQSTPKQLKSPLDAIYRNLLSATMNIEADIVHCHTWYSHFGGVLAKLAYGIPLVITVHSLEPLRPWKREQIGRGYDLSSWIEKTALEMADAIIAVSLETKEDIIRLFKIDEKKIQVIPNGIDVEHYRPVDSSQTLTELGIDKTIPYVLFVGRITRQKGIIHLVNALQYLDENIQVVLCAGQPDTPEIADEMQQGVAKVQKFRKGIFWVKEMLPRKKMIELYTHASVFCCPSVYEPFGIINLEAMACETAVVASRVGGIPEVVIPDQTGYLVDYNKENIETFEKNMAHQINAVIQNPELGSQLGKAGRIRAEKYFSWKSIAERTVHLYEEVIQHQKENH